ncbi:MAG: hypothetical protein JWN40_2991 [Phycisphaerales bacterium]|nr:hypothetical protein [Phycisphaerales bacterium]
MSQFPYSPPPHVPYGYPQQDPLGHLLAPAKRASVCMFVLSGMMIPCGLLMGLMSAMISKADLSQLPPESAAMLRQAEQQFAAAGITLSGFFGFVAVAMVVMGVLALILGVMVRKGGLGSIVSSIIICCLLGLMAGLSVIGGLSGAAQGQAQAMLGTCMWGVLLVLLIFALVSLFQAAKNSGQLNAYRMGYQAQMQQYQQNVHGYPGQQPSQQPQNWQQPGPGQQWGQPAWPPQPQQPPPPQQNWPPPPPPPSNPT